MKPETPSRPDSASAAEGTEFITRSAQARASVLRATRAVTGVLLVAFVLGLALAGASYRAAQNQRRAEAAESEARERWWNASLAQARAERLSTVAGHRAAALAAVSNAAAIRPSVELRNEAIASLGLRDLERAVLWPLPSSYGYNFDPQLDHYVTRLTHSELTMFRLADNRVVRTFRSDAAGVSTNIELREFFFSPRGTYLTTRYWERQVVLWERQTGRPAHVFGRDPGSDKFAWPPSYTADERWLCARSLTRTNHVLLYDLVAQTNRDFTVAGVNDTVRLSPRGDVFSFFRIRKIYLHDARTGVLRRTLDAPTEPASMSWDQIGDQFSIGCRDGSVHIWDQRTGHFRQLGGSAVNPFIQLFSPDGTQLVTAGADGLSRLWDVSEARLLAQQPGGRAVVFGLDGQRVGYGTPGREIGVWRVTAPTACRTFQGTIRQRASTWHQDLSPNGRWAAWAPPPSTRLPSLELFDLDHPLRPSLFLRTEQFAPPAFHPTEPKMVFAVSNALKLVSLREDDPPTGPPGINELRTIPLPAGFDVHTLSLDGTGRRIAALSTKGVLGVAHLEAPGGFTKFDERFPGWIPPGPGSRTGSGGLAFSPDGRWIAAGYTDSPHNKPTVWDATNGNVVHRFPITLSHVAFSRDGRWLATIGLHSCTLWETGTWRQIWKLARAPLLSEAGAVAFSGDGKFVAYLQNFSQVDLVATSTGTLIATLNTPEILAVRGLRFSDDSGRLLVTGNDGIFQLWDLHALRSELGRLRLDWKPDEGSEENPAINGPVSLATGESRLKLTPALLAGTGLAAVAMVAVLGGVVLRRQRRLTQDFIHTTELAAHQARELVTERELNELKSRFVSMVSHEFRTPLGITMSAVELLRNHLELLDAEKRAELLEDIFGSTRHMAGLMEQVLLLGRVEAGKLAFRPVPTNVVALCEKLADECSSATKRRCEFVLHAAPDLPHALVDESLLRHVFSNLLSNAAKYSPAGATVDFSVHAQGADAIFSVRDHGIGIPADDLPKLFQTFHRAGNVGDIPGTGLGLTIAKRCVDLHDGRIDVQSQPGAGTTITVRLRNCFKH